MTRLTPPAQQSRLLVRQRVDRLLADAVHFPLTCLIAPAGSGKTTALASFTAHDGYPSVWCRITPSDDPVSLLGLLAAAFRPFVPTVEQRIHSAIEQMAETTQAYFSMLDMLANELASALPTETLLVMDDYHYADRRPELRTLIEYFISTQPKRLHLVLSTRERPLLASLPVQRARGEVYQLTQADLAFSVEETQELLKLYGQPFTADMAALNEECRGWPLAIQMLVTQLSRQQRTGDSPGDQIEDELLADIGEVEPSSTPHVDLSSLYPLLDEYFTRQVLHDQPPEIQEFLLRTAGLRWFDQGVCAVLPGLRDTSFQQMEVERRCLFLETLPNGRLTYQPVFRGFLERVALQQLQDRRDLHLRAADYYRSQNDHEGAIYHLLATDEGERAAAILEQVAVSWIRLGHAQDVVNWLGRLPADQQQRPMLLEVHAVAQRSQGNFEQALQLYQQAEEGFRERNDLEGQVRVLRGRVEIYLDTVQPAPAVALLKQALKLLPRDRHLERAEILRLQAENWANRGRADVALKLETCARNIAARSQNSNAVPAEQSQLLAPIPTPLLISRLMLRSGRLNESLRHLEANLGLSPQSGLEQTATPAPTLAHREPSLLLALVYTLLGKDARALATARRGLLEAQQGGAALTTAIAHMRVGHAYQIITPLDAAAARGHYQRALELLESVGVPRTKVEAFMGLVLLYGHSGDLGSAESIAQEALKVAEEAGDEWIAALIWLALGGAAVVMSDERAPEWLDQACQRFLRGRDKYGQAVVSLWLALWYLYAGKAAQASEQVSRLMELTREYGYEGLLTAPTLFGPRDLAMLIPILLHGRSLPDHATFSQQLLRQAFPSVASDEMVEDYHPGYTLRIQMLGSFRVWRGIREVQTREWQREKARQLLQLLLTYRGQWLQREQICAWLWPDSDLDAAERQFKVTLNALNSALEPMRPPRTMPFFVRRQGLAYSFAPSYGCWIDVDEFELRTTSVVQSDVEFIMRNSQIAVQLYKGDYLAEALYDPWTLEERERLMARYLATATGLAARLLEKGDAQQSVQLCEAVLRRDRCYEEAYQVLMRVYARNGSRSQALRTYSRCIQALQDELGIDPLPETTDLYEHIKRNERV